MSDDVAVGEAAATVPVVVERTEDGKWAKGVSGNPSGRPPSRKQTITALKQTLEEYVRNAVRPERIVKILETLCDKAEAGDVKAAQTILAYTLSKPTESDDAPVSGGIVIRIENATFKAQKEQQQIIEGTYEH